MTFIQRRINVDATLYKRHAPPLPSQHTHTPHTHTHTHTHTHPGSLCTWEKKNNVQLNTDLLKLTRCSYLLICAPNEDADQPAHPRCLTSLRCPNEENSFPWLSQMRPAKSWSVCANAHADLNLPSAHISKGTFFCCYGSYLLGKSIFIQNIA